ncbi:MAG: hypothetical protein QOG99_272, partial [Frankiales bacterium]|nr:hypothetical protein [Frankiales bacterium]
MRRTQLVIPAVVALACTAALVPASTAAVPSTTPSFGVPRI